MISPQTYQALREAIIVACDLRECVGCGLKRGQIGFPECVKTGQVAHDMQPGWRGALRLSHVLRAVNKVISLKENWLVVWQNGHMTFRPPKREDGYSGANWNLEADDLDAQSDETKEWLASLLVKETV